MKRILTALVGFVLLLTALAGCGTKEDVPAATSKEQPVTLVLATDLHYISPAICDNGEAFHTAVENGDGKTMFYIQEIMEAFVDEMAALQPDAVLLTGDLTFSGAKASHEDLAKLLEKLSEAGVQVLTIPGNHDLENTSALAFSGADYWSVDSITGEEFGELYAPFGLDQALSRDDVSLSYVYAPRKDLRVLMLDTNAGAWCSVTDETMEWVEKQLKAAKRAGAKVVAASHQNMDVHSPMFTWSYQIVNGDKLRTLYEKYGVICNLSGHLHIQHIMGGVVPEVATSALAINPNQYGLITYDGETFSYETKVLDVSGWAAKNGSTDPDLLDFATYARNFMIDTAREKQAKKLAGGDMSEAEAALLADTFARLNAVYFAGDPVDPAEYEEGLSLWQNGRGNRYLETIVGDGETDHHRLTVKVK